MPKRRGNLNTTIPRRPPIGPLQRKRSIRQRSTTVLRTLFMTSAGCRLRKLRWRPQPRLTQPVPLRRRQKAAQQLSQVLFPLAFLLQTSKQKYRKANPVLLWPPRRAHQLLGRNLYVGGDR